jgi:hypothetical protein
MSPIQVRTPSELVARMPVKALADLVEWGPFKDPQQQFGIVNPNRYSLDDLIALSPDTPALQDDRPVNEYYFLRTPCPDCIPEWNTCARVCIRDSANSCTLAQSSPAANGNCIVMSRY